MPKWWNPPHWHYTGVMVATRINFLFPFFIFSQVHCHHQWQTQNPSLSTPPMATPKKKKISTKRKSNHQLHPQKEKIFNHQYHHQPHKLTSITTQSFKPQLQTQKTQTHQHKIFRSVIQNCQPKPTNTENPNPNPNLGILRSKTKIMKIRSGFLFLGMYLCMDEHGEWV